MGSLKEEEEADEVVTPDFGYDYVRTGIRSTDSAEAGVEFRRAGTSNLKGPGGGKETMAVSIRDDAKFHQHTKKQGHNRMLSAKLASSHGRTEGGSAGGDAPGAGGSASTGTTNGRPGLFRKMSSGSAEGLPPASKQVRPGLFRKLSSGNAEARAGVDVVEPPKHAKKQGHNATLSIANLIDSSGHNTRFMSGSVHGADESHRSDVGRMDDTGHGSNAVAGDDDFFIDGGPEPEKTIEEDEMFAREDAESRPVLLWFWNGLSSVLVFIRYLISVDSTLSLLLSCGMTYYSWATTKDDDNFDGTMSFILLGFAVLMPLSVSVRIVFARREKALENIASLQTHAQHIYLCHACWDWGKAPGARSADPNRWLKHSDKVLRCLVAVGDELTRFLTLPNSSFSRHRETGPGRREAAVTIGASYRIFGDVVNVKVTRLTKLLEELKLAGFSASEASRVRQYEKLLTQAAHNLRMLKMYRSPKALNALLNLTATLLPPFYAPAFAQIAHDSQSLGMGIAFAAITSLALSALYASVQVLEDPFVAFLTLDGIDVYEELAVLFYHQLIKTRSEIFPDADLFNEDEEDDTLSGIFESVTKRDTSVPTSPALDRRAMLKGQISSRSSMKLAGSRQNMGEGGKRQNSSLLRRQSAYKLDLPPEFKREHRGSKTSRRNLLGSFIDSSE
eukprot:CAMPEP_0113544222 /NCGR_PEP_ID=MMETSP0015_2-20120614/10591_1 /TAXON_ID=2838 /ORGANISM="Odontella" /LENGTH=674 /DNA_ID=CAMNT_0000444463 /DNA_START=211 /DNA_END=2235 /DNA_ORIENTATION=- /assembly_acc=CAM_ASM_000160